MSASVQQPLVQPGAESAGESAAQSRQNPPASYPAWAPRFWHGMLLSDWLRLALRNRLRIHPARWGLATTVTTLTALNSCLRWVDQVLFARRVARTTVAEPPIFIIGHWRSGTTFLHELMSCDPRFATPTTYQCFAANHFLTTQHWLPALVWYVMPSRRPMDNVRMGWGEPQEDEFALCSMGAASPYLRMAFPNSRQLYLDYLDLRQVDPSERQRWERALVTFLKALTWTTGKRLILKSPTHTARVALLARLFPGARFVHIVRHPYRLFASTRRLWQVLDEAQGLQRPHHRSLDRYIFRVLNRMYRAFHHDRAQLPRGQICDVRYEELTRDPVGQVERVYCALELGEFDAVRPRLQSYADQAKTYRTNRYQLDPSVRREITRRWAQYFQRYGYSPDDELDEIE